MSYRIDLFREAEKTLQTLDRVIERRIREKLRELAQAPLDPRLSNQMETAKDGAMPEWATGASSSG